MVKHMVMWSFKEEIPEEKKPELKAHPAATHRLALSFLLPLFFSMCRQDIWRSLYYNGGWKLR